MQGERASGCSVRRATQGTSLEACLLFYLLEVQDDGDTSAAGTATSPKLCNGAMWVCLRYPTPHPFRFPLLLLCVLATVLGDKMTPDNTHQRGCGTVSQLECYRLRYLRPESRLQQLRDIASLADVSFPTWAWTRNNGIVAGNCRSLCLRKHLKPPLGHHSKNHSCLVPYTARHYLQPTYVSDIPIGNGSFPG